MRIVADQRGRTVATVTTAVAARATRSAARLERRALARATDGTVSLNTVIDPAVVGGLRVQIADDVIDGSVSARLADLRQRLAG